MFKYIKIKIEKNFLRFDFFKNLKEFLQDKNLIFMFTKGLVKNYYALKVPLLCNMNELEKIILPSESLLKINDAKKYFYDFDEENLENNDEEVFQEITMDTSEFFLSKNDEETLMCLKSSIRTCAIIIDKSNICTNVLFYFEDDGFDFFWIAYTEESDFKEYINKTPALLKQVIE